MSWEDSWICAVCGKEATSSFLSVKFCNTHLTQRQGYEEKDMKYEIFERERK